MSNAYGGREAPQALEAENALLGGILQDNEALNEILKDIRSSDFYLEKHVAIFDAMVDLNQDRSPIDVVSLAEKLASIEKLNLVGGREYLFHLMESVASAANANYHAQLIRSKSLLRALIHAGNGIIREALDPAADPKGVLDRAERDVFAISEQQITNSLRPVKEILPLTLSMIERYRQDELSGVPTGFRDLDLLTNGLQGTDLIVLAGRPGMGKTAFALSLMANAAIVHRRKVAFFSLEMGAEQLVQRILCARAGISQQLLRTGRLPRPDYAKITTALSPINDAAIYIDDQPGLTLNELRSKCRSLARRCEGLDLIIVDYLQLMDIGDAENRNVGIGNLSRGLKMLAKELKLPILSLAQLSRKAEDPNRKGRPMLSDLRESGSIEQDADMVWFVHRPWMYNHGDERGQNYAELLVVKHRNGPTDDIKLTFIGEQAAFYDFIQESQLPVGDFQ